jgi:hypothetical protein
VIFSDEDGCSVRDGFSGLKVPKACPGELLSPDAASTWTPTLGVQSTSAEV